MNANLEASYTVPETLTLEQEHDVKAFLYSNWTDALSAKQSFKVTIHRYMSHIHHSDDEFCECGVVEMIIPNDPSLELDQLYKEYLSLCKSIH